MSLSVQSAMNASIEALAGRVGSYIPHSAGMGASYLSGGAMRADPARFGVPNAPSVTPPTQIDQYIPSFDFAGIEWENTPIEENMSAPAENHENTQLPDEKADLPEEETDSGEQNDDADTTDAAGIGYAAINNSAAETGAPNAGENAQNPDKAVAEEDAGPVSGEYTPEQQKVIDELQQRDAEVRAHEQAHISVGGAYIRGGASYEYESGPDKKRYAVGGEVQIDTSPVRDNPEATIEKMQVVRAAAMAPAEPSGQDRAVAAAASHAEGQARAELSERRAAEANGEGEDGGQNASANNNSNQQNAATDENARPSRIMAGAVSAYTGNNQAMQAIMSSINFAA
ncbi:MAG: hypothetical protein FWC23_09220 [Chitinispirillia bacterium]|nr:hypothetical protein [Chitinispirillia bacterium]MCL2269349.1 hypothetical protein [Chitinispirillia bacterium]